jgi:putative glutamine amidotransferase
VNPVVGLTTYREPARWGVWDQHADLLPTSYARSVELAGGIPVLLPPLPAEAAEPVLARLDALVVCGGADVDPERYAQEPHPATGTPRTDRDTWELALLAAAERNPLPVLGVCRGMQLMAVAAAGSLVQHLPDELGEGVDPGTHDPGGDGFGEVGVTVDPGSRLASLLGAGADTVRCHHHQAVATHPGLVVSARAEDGTVEALERPGERFWLGVQWHPEVITDAGLWRGLVEAAVR